MREFSAPAPECVEKALGREATNHWLLFDNPGELADYAIRECPSNSNMNARTGFAGPHDAQETAKRTREGDLSCVEKADALLSRFERFAFETGRKAWLDDVTGAIPNVPAFIAGHPLAMRRRARQDSAAAPLAIIADLTTSAGLSTAQIEARGSAILALVRILSARRPVELWAGCMVGAGGCDRDLCAVFCQIESAPLDLARAAYVMTGAGFPRRLCYGIAECRHNFRGGWPYNNTDASKQNLTAICAQAFHHASETLCIPPIHVRDLLVKSPEVWIEQKLAELSPVDLAA